MSRRAELSAPAGLVSLRSPLRDAGRGPEVWHRCKCGRPIPLKAKRCSARTCLEFGPVWARDTRRRLLENLHLVRLSVMFLGHGAGTRPLPLRSGLLRAWPGGSLLWEDRLPGQPGRRGRVQSPGRRMVERAAPGSIDAGQAEDGIQRQARYPCLGEAEARARARARCHLGFLACRAGLGESLRRGVARAGAGEGLRIRRRLAQDRAQVLARRSGGRLLVELLRSRRGRKAPITENVLAGDLPQLVVFVGPHLTAKTCCTMRNLRNARRVWAWRQGLIEKPELEERELDVAACLLHRLPIATRAP